MTEDKRLVLLCDSRPLHLALFTGLAPADWPDAAGTWRGSPGSSVVDAPRAVFLARRLPGLRARDLCLPAAEVPAAMDDLAQHLCSLWDQRPGADDPWRDAGFQALARMTARFFAIHPYMDGNGHIWRLSLPVLAERLGLAMRTEWTIDRRPYGPEFSLALQWYGDHPAVLTDQLRRWMRPMA
ncbi:MAG: Fic family protein [Rubellimicrobium sp.]|nr:Fic family protein [Rubellimicrobium sp.]